MRIALFEELEHLVDQLCIAQHDMKEKRTAVGTMDVAYRNTRAIIVALEDVQLGQEAAVAIKAFDGVAPQTCVSVS